MIIPYVSSNQMIPNINENVILHQMSRAMLSFSQMITPVVKDSVIIHPDDKTKVDHNVTILAESWKKLSSMLSSS
jgi:hypothetical protein